MNSFVNDLFNMKKAILSLILLFAYQAKAQYNCMDTKQTLGGMSGISINNNAKSDSFDIKHYDLSLDLYSIAQGRSNFKAVAEIDFAAKLNGINRLNLDLYKLQVDSILFWRNGNASSAFSHSYNDSLLAITFSNNYAAGDSGKLRIYYHGSPQGDPLNWGGFHSQSGYYYNLGVGFGANPHTYGRAWFPCYDNFVEKSTYSLSVLSKDPLKPLISGDQISRVLSGDSLISSAELQEEIPTYLVSFALANYEFLSDTVQGANGSIDILLAAKAADTSNLKASFINLKPTFHAYENYFGPYQWPRVGYAATTVGAMEHATSIHFPISLINGNLNGEDIMAHELAHHWFGNLITCETSDDMWINEGMAEFSSHLYEEYVYGPDAYYETVKDNAWKVLNLAAARDGNLHRPLFGMPHEYVYGYHVYQKGAMVGHNMRHYMGDSLFFGSLQQLFDDHAYGNLSSTSMRDEMIRISGLNSLADFWQDWVFEPGYPQFSVENWNYSDLLQRLDIEIKQRVYAAPNYFNSVPVSVTCFAADGRKVSFKLNHSGELSQHQGLLLGFRPIAVLASYEPSFLTATGVDHIHIDQNGSWTAPYGGWTLSTNNYSDSGSVIVMQHLVAPQKDSANPFDFNLSKSRYFSLQQLYYQNTSIEAELRFDGSNRGKDQGLLQSGNDSLVLLYRAKGSHQWRLYPFAQKQVSSPNSKIGSFKLDTVLDGDYCFANSKESLGANEELQLRSAQFEVFPNPAEKFIRINYLGDEDIDFQFELISRDGKKLMDSSELGQFEGKSLQFAIDDYPAGQYLLIINKERFPILIK